MISRSLNKIKSKENNKKNISLNLIITFDRVVTVHCLLVEEFLQQYPR